MCIRDSYLTNAQIGGERSSDALNTVAKLRGQFAEARSDPRIDLAEAEAAFLLSDNKRVLVATDRAVIKANASGAKLLAARARALQCRALANLGQSQQSLAAGAEARRLYHQAGDLSGEAQALHSMAEVPLNQGDLEQAKQLYEQALELARKVGDQRAAGRELGNIGLILIPVSYTHLDVYKRQADTSAWRRSGHPDRREHLRSVEDQLLPTPDVRLRAPIQAHPDILQEPLPGVLRHGEYHPCSR